MLDMMDFLDEVNAVGYELEEAEDTNGLMRLYWTTQSVLAQMEWATQGQEPELDEEYLDNVPP